MVRKHIRKMTHNSGSELRNILYFRSKFRDVTTTLHLKGLVYYGDFHFTCRIIDESGSIWFHDGMTTEKISIKDGKFGSVSQPNLKECRNKQLCLVVTNMDLALPIVC
jgi:hypothetical protein